MRERSKFWRRWGGPVSAWSSVLFLAPGVSVAAAEGSQAQVVEIRRLDEPPVIDGVLDSAWERAGRVTEFYEVSPAKNAPPPAETIAYIGYDADNLYFAVHAKDAAPGVIRAIFTDRDKIHFDDFFGLLVDPFGDGRRAYEFWVNPHGIQTDLVRVEGQGEDYAYDAIWQSAGRITEDGWVAEAAVPLRSLRFRPDAAATWHAGFLRVRPRSARTQIVNWKYDYDNPCLSCQLPLLEGLGDVRPGRNFELVPTLTGSYTDAQAAGVDRSLDPGISLKYGFAPNVTLDATANPDFNQVEADVNQLDVNTRFALSFAERRPFFIESQDYFKVSGVQPGWSVAGIPGGFVSFTGAGGQLPNLYYSRAVGQPDFAAKFTGKLRADQFGVLVARQDTTNVVVPTPDGSAVFGVPASTTASVARYRREVGGRSAAGVFLSDLRGGGGHSSVVAADFLLRPHGNLDLAGQFAHSSADALGSASLGSYWGNETRSANAFSLQARVASRQYAVQGGYTDVGRDFRSDLGFIRQADLRTSEISGLYQYVPEREGFLVRAGPGFKYLRATNHDGLLIEESYFPGVVGILRGPLWFWVAGAFSNNYFAGSRFTGQKRLLAEVHARPNRHINPINFSFIHGDLIDFTNKRLGRGDQLSVGVVVKPTDHLALDLGAVHESLDRKDTGDEVYHAEIARANAEYWFTPRLFLRWILQWSWVTRDPAQYLVPESVPPNQRTFASFLLFGYRLNPRTAFFVGYNDSSVRPKGLFGSSDAPCTSDSPAGVPVQGNPRGLGSRGATLPCRTFFVKVGYGFE